MLWSEDTRRALSLLAQRSDSVPPPARALVAAMRRANSYAGRRILFGITNGPTPQRADVVAPAINMLLVKPVGDRCNLACIYCYEEARRSSAKSGALTVDDFERMLDHVLPYVKPPLDIYFHGGEPLLRGLDFFSRAVGIISRRDASSWIRLGVQSNATLIDQAWARFFREASINVGVSLDGPPAVHDALRIARSGHGSYERALQGIRHLQDEGVRFGAICVLARQHAELSGAADALFEHLKNIGINEYDVHPAWSAFGPGRSENLSPVRYAAFISRLFDRWLEEGDPGIIIRSFEQFFQAMTGVLGDACYRAGKCTGILGVDPSGDVTPCTRPFDRAYNFGNLIESPMPEILGHRMLSLFVARERDGRARARDCQWARLCGWGGCPHERTTQNQQDVEGAHVYCTCHTGAEGGYPAIFAHMIRRTECALSDALVAQGRAL
jgi:uncharacterized protein